MSFINYLFKRHFLYLGIMPFIFFMKGLLSYPFHITSADLLICISALTSSTFFLYWINFYLLKDRYKAAYYTFIITILFVSSIDVYYVLFAKFLRVRYFLLIIILFLGLCLWIFKTRQFPKEINKFINIFSILFFCLFLFNSQQAIHTFFVTLEKQTSDLKTTGQQDFQSNEKKRQQLPDIYLLLLDGYANSNNLKEYWHFSNDTFLNNLRQQGFHVVDSSRSNYASTVQTVSSMLNMNYCQKYTKNETPFLAAIANNKTVDILAQNSYTIYNYSLFDFDKYLSPNRLNAFPGKVSLLYHCLTGSVYFFYNNIFVSQKESLQPDRKDRQLYDQLIETTKIRSDKPKFVYGHFFVSHPPFYLDSTGKVDRKIQELSMYTIAESNQFGNEDTTDNTFGNPQRDRFMMEFYLNHIKATNRYVEPLVKTILANASEPPIILIMSDHGFRYATGISNSKFENERYGNLCAFYFPDKNYNELSDSITPVNYMRLILSKALGTPYQPLPNKSRL